MGAPTQGPMAGTPGYTNERQVTPVHTCAHQVTPVHTCARLAGPPRQAPQGSMLMGH